jgi:FkbM family methyltransferase
MAVLPGLIDLAGRVLPRHLAERAFRQLAARLGVSSFTIGGEYGPFEGSPRDDTVHAYYLQHGTYEPALHALLRDHVFAGGCGTLIDVGANIGLTSVPVAKARQVTCHCFEPDPFNFGLLRRNVQANGVEHLFHLHPLALMAQDGSFTLELSPDNLGDHRIRAGGPSDRGRAGVLVQARRLDDVLDGEDLARPVALKLDVQGAEVRVLDGGRRTLERVGVAVVEYSPDLLGRMGDPPERLFEHLAAFPYGEVITPGRELKALRPTPLLLDELRRVRPRGRAGELHVDVVLSRTPEV